jgi:Fic family protein
LDRRSFRPEGWAQIVRGVEGHDACVPRNLPPELPMDAPLISALSAADRALGRLAGVAINLPNPRLLIRSFISREAVLSSRIEGTRTTLSDLFLFEVTPGLEERVPDVREVFNYIRALDHGLARLRQIPLSLNLIREMHGILLEDVRGAERHPGQFRNQQNWIGSGRDIADAIYVPPPRERLGPLLDAFERFVNTPIELPLLVRLAMIHYQFEAIHPFEDGNGRLGRLLISILLDAERALPHPVLYLSAYFERHRAEYYDHLLHVGQHGAWRAWVQFFLRGVAEQSIDAVERSQQLLALRQRWAELCQTARTSALLLKLLDGLFRNPYVSVALAAKQLGIRPQSAQHNIDRLVAHGILKEVTGKARNRVFAAREILRILEQTPAFDGAQPEGNHGSPANS